MKTYINSDPIVLGVTTDGSFYSLSHFGLSKLNGPNDNKFTASFGTHTPIIKNLTIDNDDFKRRIIEDFLDTELSSNRVYQYLKENNATYNDLVEEEVEYEMKNGDGLAYGYFDTDDWDEVEDFFQCDFEEFMKYAIDQGIAEDKDSNFDFSYFINVDLYDYADILSIDYIETTYRESIETLLEDEMVGDSTLNLFNKNPNLNYDDIVELLISETDDSFFIDCSCDNREFTVRDFDIILRSDSGGQHDAREEMYEIFDNELFQDVMDMWDKFHLKPMTAPSDLEKLTEIVDRLLKVNSEDLMQQYIEDHIDEIVENTIDEYE